MDPGMQAILEELQAAPSPSRSVEPYEPNRWGSGDQMGSMDQKNWWNQFGLLKRNYL